MGSEMCIRDRFQYRHPCRENPEAEVDSWGRPFEVEDLPENLIGKDLCVQAEDFGEAQTLVPGSLFGPTSTQSAIGDKVYSLLSKDERPELGNFKLYPRTVVGVNFPLYLWMFHESVDALAIENAWLTLPLIRQGKATRGTKGSGLQQRAKGKSSWKTSWDESNWSAGSSWSAQGWNYGHWRTRWDKSNWSAGSSWSEQGLKYGHWRTG